MNISSFRNHCLSVSSVAFIGLLLPACASSVAESDGRVGADVEAIDGLDCPAGVPAALTPAPDQRLWFFLQGDGVQIYDCKAAGWSFRAPDASLLDPGGEVVGSHYVGPTWQYEDGSTVSATKVAGVTVDTSAIPWLLLKAVSHSGDGRMTEVTTIQRLSTVGGLAPATGCDADHIGAVARVPYTATYAFYRTHDGGDNPQCGG